MSDAARAVRWFLRGGRVYLGFVLCGLGFLFACNGLFDGDFWWHLRAGEWIIEHGTVPDLDPFTFGSADQHWIDLHWLFQVVLAHVYHAGGVPAVIVAQALVAAVSVLAGLACRRAGTSMTVVVLCWLPALFVMQSRFQTRPEMLSLLFLGVWLAIVSRLDERPRLAWLLAVVQLVWVNVHGLFILGPIVLGLWLLVRVGSGLRRRLSEPGSLTAESRRWWRHVGGATVLVGVACVLNPYGLKGVLFPFVLFPKITDPANPYKNYIAEFESPSTSFRTHEDSGPVTDVPHHQMTSELRYCFRLLLVFVPLSFVFPAAVQLARPPDASGTEGKPPSATHPPLAWLAGLLLCFVLAAMDAARALGAAALPDWWPNLADAVPVGFLVALLVFGLARVRRSDPAGWLLVSFGLAAVGWVWWLDRYFTQVTVPEFGIPALLCVVCGGYACYRYVRSGCDLFPLLLVGAFGYLALNAVNNFARFGLVFGVVLVWNLGRG